MFSFFKKKKNALAPAESNVSEPHVEESSTQLVKATPTQPVQQWEISVSFGKSTSKSFNQALFLAKAAWRYDEYDMNGVVVHQAWFRADKDEFLAFTRLYELVGNWKSSAVMINGQLIDRKIIGGINYCYGDKCRNGRSDFCFGASMFTDNPFGCHRLQISTHNNPWWSFGEWKGDTFLVNKTAMRNRIDEYCTAYTVCPDFNYEAVLYRLKMLPDKIKRADYSAVSMGDKRFIEAIKNAKFLG